MQRTPAIAFTVVGAFTALMWILLLFRVCDWNLVSPGVSPTVISITIAMVNIAGLIFLIRHRRHFGPGLFVAGVAGNGLSLFINCFSTLGYIFIKYIFHM